MPNNKNSLTKKALYLLAIFSFLTTITNCGCVNPTSPKPTTDPDMKSNENIFVFPENSITIKKFVDLNIMDTLRPGSNYTPNDVSIAFSPGVDMLIADTNNLNIDVANGTISGSLKLKQRLDCENPIDDNVDNDYVIATFNMVDNGNTINDELKLIVRITDVEVEVTKVEILIDKFHLPAGNVLRGIKELYLYEDSNVSNSISGDDPNNFISPDLIASATVIGEVYPGSDITKLYDKDDVNDGFLIDTANTNMSNIYHRLTFNFKEKVNLKKVAIKSRQSGGYEGFYFIIRDESNHILYVQRANVKASGTDATATSTYSFVPSYRLSRYPISDFDIRKNNNNFTLYENSTNFFLIDNLHVTMGYEYERGFVKFSRPGADIEKFNTNNVFFIYNQLMGLSLKNPPDFEMPDDADNNNIYELGTVTITNVDGGRINFPLSVRTLDLPSTITLNTNAVSLAVDIYTSNIIENLLEFVDFTALEINTASVGDFIYNFELTGDDASYFKTIRNTLKTAGDFGFRSIYDNGGEYNVRVNYIPDNGISQALDVTIRIITEPQWREISTSIIRVNGRLESISTPWRARSYFQAVAFNDDILIMGGVESTYDYINDGLTNDIWRSSDGGENWRQITSSADWSGREGFQTVVLTNNDILVMGGATKLLRIPDVSVSTNANGKVETSGLQNITRLGIYTNDIWRSSDGGENWTLASSSAPWTARIDFQAVVLTNNDILVMGGREGLTYYLTNDIWRSSDGGGNWDLVSSSAPWPAKEGFQAVVLTNNNILVIGGRDVSGLSSTMYLSSDGGRNWSQITNSTPWRDRADFQAVVLPNNDILVMGGYAGDRLTLLNDIWLSSNGGTNWTDITPIDDHWIPRFAFQALFIPNKGVFFLGGFGERTFKNNDIWVREGYNHHYFSN